VRRFVPLTAVRRLDPEHAPVTVNPFGSFLKGMSSVRLMIPIVVTAPVVLDRSSTHGLQMLGGGAAVGVASAARQCRADESGGKENVHGLIPRGIRQRDERFRPLYVLKLACGLSLKHLNIQAMPVADWWLQ